MERIENVWKLPTSEYTVRFTTVGTCGTMIGCVAPVAGSSGRNTGSSFTVAVRSVQNSFGGGTSCAEAGGTAKSVARRTTVSNTEYTMRFLIPSASNRWDGPRNRGAYLKIVCIPGASF